MTPSWPAIGFGALVFAAVLFVGGWVIGKLLFIAERRRRPRAVIVTITADMTGFEQALANVSRAFDKMKVDIGTSLLPAMRGFAAAMANGVVPALDRLREEVEWRQYLERQRKIAVLSMRVGVHAGLDPACRTLSDLHAVVWTILNGTRLWTSTAHPVPLLSLTDEERLELAVSAIHGWSSGWGRHAAREQLAEVHRWGSSDVVLVLP